MLFLYAFHDEAILHPFGTLFRHGQQICPRVDRHTAPQLFLEAALYNQPRSHIPRAVFLSDLQIPDILDPPATHNKDTSAQKRRHLLHGKMMTEGFETSQS